MSISYIGFKKSIILILIIIILLQIINMVFKFHIFNYLAIIFLMVVCFSIGVIFKYKYITDEDDINEED